MILDTRRMRIAVRLVSGWSASFADLGRFCQPSLLAHLTLPLCPALRPIDIWHTSLPHLSSLSLSLCERIGMSSSSGALGTYQAVQLMKLSKTQSEGIDLLQLNTLPRPSLGPDEIRVRVHASALNFFDLLMLQGKYQYRPPMPFTVGSEASGVIIEVGATAAQKWKVGDAVIVGMTNGDSMASEIVTSCEKAIKKPPQYTHAEAAGLPVGFFTNW